MRTSWWIVYFCFGAGASGVDQEIITKIKIRKYSPYVLY